ncbi:MAG: hypothetical protein AAGM38_09585 [Pseudomonadota bacterium]
MSGEDDEPTPIAGAAEPAAASDGAEALSPEAAAAATERARARAEGAIEDIHRFLPYLAEIADEVSIATHPRVPTACVFADGRLLVGRDWFGALTREEALFVMAHELWHLILRTHDRLGRASDPRAARLMNIAHDYVINDILADELGAPVPCGGLVWPGARDLSAEYIIKTILEDQAPTPPAAWDPESGGGAARGGDAGGRASGGGAAGDARNSALGDALAKAGLTPPPRPRLHDGVFQRDALREDEWDLFGAGARPLLGPRRPGGGAARVAEIARRTLERAALDGRAGRAVFGPDRAEDGRREVMKALETDERIPIELAFQSGFDLLATPRRSYGRPSRRQGDRTDLVLAGRVLEGYSLNLILDTSGSMHALLRRLAGSIKTSAEAAEIAAINVIQSGKSYDRALSDVEIDRVETFEFTSYEIDGWTGATPLHRAFERYEQEPNIETVGIITDMGEPYPETPPPFEVVWFWTDDDFGYWDPPAYGQIVKLKVDWAWE